MRDKLVLVIGDIADSVIISILQDLVDAVR